MSKLTRCRPRAFMHCRKKIKLKVPRDSLLAIERSLSFTPMPRSRAASFAYVMSRRANSARRIRLVSFSQDMRAVYTEVWKERDNNPGKQQRNPTNGMLMLRFASRCHWESIRYLHTPERRWGAMERRGW